METSPDELARFVANTVGIYSVLQQWIFPHTAKMATDEEAIPNEVDNIILEMAGVKDVGEFLDNGISEDTEALFQQLQGPNGYTIFKAWMARHR